MRAFFDTNILIYGLVPEADDSVSTDKHPVAAQLVDRCVEANDFVISTQVMSEFYVNATRKGKCPLTHAAAALALEKMSLLEVVAIDKELVLQAAVRMMRSRMSYWDALIVEAARSAGARVVYTEDMQHGMRFDSVEVRNPFLGLDRS